MRRIITYPPLTPKQKEILQHIYYHRFMTRKHLQTILQLKDYHRPNSWLKDLTEKGYLNRYYLPTINPYMAPPIYYLLPPAASHIPKLSPTDKLALARRLKEEANRSDRFIKRCLILCDLYCHFLTQPNLYTNVTFWPKIRLTKIFDREDPVPDAFLKITLCGANNAIRRYLIYVIDEHMGRKKVASILTRVGDFYESETWLDYIPQPFPKIMVVVPDRDYRSYLYRVLSAIQSEQVEPMQSVLVESAALKGVPQFPLKWHQVT